MHRRLIRIAVSLALVAPLLGGTAHAAPGRRSVLTVAPDGRASACVPHIPCSLDTAQRLVRQRLGSGAGGDLVIEFTSGTYPPFGLDEDDSAAGARVIYRAASGAHPVISGGTVIRGWSPGPDGTYVADVPTTLRSRQLYVNGERAFRARSDSRNQVPSMTVTEVGFRLSRPVSWSNPQDVTFRFQAGGANWPWTDQQCGVASIGGTAVVMDQPCWSRLRNAVGGVWGGPGSVENVLELLDQPGEWYLDQAKGRIYYKPRPGQQMATAQVVAATSERLLDVRGRAGRPVENVTVQGLTFAYGTWLGPDSGLGVVEGQSNWMGCEAVLCQSDDNSSQMIPANVELSRVRNVRIVGNVFAHLGGAGLAVRDGSVDNVVQGNEFTDISGTNVQIGSYEDPTGLPGDEDRGTLVADNYIHDSVREYLGGSAVVVGFASGVIVRNNEVKNTAYSSVQMGWHTTDRAFNYQSANQALANDLSGAMNNVLRDGGLLYTNGKNTVGATRGRVDRNWLHDVEHGTALYIDDGSSDIDAASNIVSGAESELYVQTITSQYARNNALTGNYFTGQGRYSAGGATVSGNTYVRDGVWPAEATQVITEAGPRPEFSAVRNPLSRNGWSVTTSSGAPAAAMLDGDLDTRTTIGATQTPDQSVTIDLRSAQRVAGIGVRTGDNTYPIGYSVQVSADGVNWSTTARSRPVASNLAADVLRLSWLPVTARYLRLTQTGTGPRPWAIGELEVNAERVVRIDEDAVPSAAPMRAGLTGGSVVVDRDDQAFERSGGFGWWGGPCGDCSEFLYFGSQSATENVGASVATVFSGQQIRLIGARTPDSGFAEISIDGGPVTEVDLYSATKQTRQVVYSSPALAYGEHRIEVKVANRKDAASTGYGFALDRARVIRIDPAKRYVLVAANNGLAATSENGKVVLRRPSGSPAQRFAVGTAADGTYRLYLPGIPNQTWRIDEPANGSRAGNAPLRLTGVGGGKVLAVPDGSVDEGTQLGLANWDGGTAQRWYFVGVG